MGLRLRIEQGMERYGVPRRARGWQAGFERNRSALIAVLALSPAFLFLLAGLLKLVGGLGGAPFGDVLHDSRWGILGFFFQGAIIAGPTLALILTLLPKDPLDWAVRLRAQRTARARRSGRSETVPNEGAPKGLGYR